MTADEIVEGAEKLGAKFNKRTLFNYTADKCLPEPKRGAGYGGKWVEYNDMDIIWATVAWRMIHGVYTEDSDSLISNVKAPRTPPKMVGLLHAEFVKCFKEYVKKNDNIDIDKLERTLQDNCWRDIAGKQGLILRGMAAWYICTFGEVIEDFGALEAQRVTEKGSVECGLKSLIECANKWNKIAHEMKE